MEFITVTDVGPRDGLQSQASSVDTEGKRRLIESLFAAGIPSVEATSFVSPKAVPQMADASSLLRSIRAPSGKRLSVLVPNLRGLDRAIEAGATEIAVVLAATDTMNRRNIGMDLAVATNTCVEVLDQAKKSGLATRAYVAVAFECPFEGITPNQRVGELAQRLAVSGAGEIVLADTIGAASPSQVEQLLGVMADCVTPSQFGMHFHDTRGMAVANAWTALKMGVRRFDSSIAGLGGCPFAPGASGNLATEDLVVMASQCGYQTGVDLALLYKAVLLAQELVGYPVGGSSIRWLASKTQIKSTEQDHHHGSH